MTIISFDFETYSECDIRKAGAYAYADHPTTEVICMAWAVDDEKPSGRRHFDGLELIL